jgi:uncharacterized LabA/DUF88 family protein
MLFVDGENLTIRAQKLLEASGRLPLESPNFKTNCFLWPGSDYTALGWGRYLETRPIRSFYYTSAVGGDDVLRLVREQIWALGFEPHVFRKDKQNNQSKGVDIALTKDMLSHAFRDNYDAAVLVSGDGDYVPLVEEVKRLGKQVIVNFIAQWTNPDLRLAADSFSDITTNIEKWAQSQKQGG